MVKRYDPYGDEDGAWMDECDEGFGSWVSYDDYAALESRVTGLERDAARYRWLRDNCQETADYYATSGQLYFGTYGYGGLDAEIDAEIEESK